MFDREFVGRIQSGKYVSLTTFRRDGTPVATPVWFVRDGDALRIITQDDSGKAKRLAHTPRVLIAPCDVRGRLTGEQVQATGHLQDGPASEQTARMVAHRYGLIGRLMMWRSQRAAGKRGASGQVGITVSAA